MNRPTDKQLMDAIERYFRRTKEGELTSDNLSELLAYAQLRALERLADNVHILNDTLSVIRADLVKRPVWYEVDEGGE